MTALTARLARLRACPRRRLRGSAFTWGAVSGAGGRGWARCMTRHGWRDAHPCDATSPRCASPHGMTRHGMACTIGSPYGGAHGGDVAHEGNRGAVPPLCVTTRRAKTVLNTGAPSQVCRETEGERLHDPDVWMIVASFVQPPRQGRGPASGGEGTAERMCGVWGDATVACCRAVVRRLCRGVRPLPVCF